MNAATKLLDSYVETDLDIIRRFGLRGFVWSSWNEVIPEQLRWNWHHDIICAALEKVITGETRKLYIGIPPGCTKSLLVSVFYPSYRWTLDPGRRFIASTYGASLTLKSARQMRDLVNSQWYRDRFSPDSRIPYQNTHAAAWFENAAHGFRFSGTVGGDVTGRHAHELLGDDLNKGQDVYGSLQSVVGTFDRSWDYWDGVLPKRLADPATSVRIYVGQMLHTRDVPNRWLAEDPEVEHVVIPMRFDPDHPFRHPDDPRTKRGELLWPEHWTEEAVQEAESRPSEYAAQFDQRPLPPGGKIITDECLSNRYERLPGQLIRTLETQTVGAEQVWKIYVDTTSKSKKQSKSKRGPDYVAIQLWCKFRGEPWLIDQDHGQWGFRATKQHIRDFADRYPFVPTIKLEDAANAPSLQDDLEEEFPGLVLESHGGGCLVRTQLVEGVWKSGSVHLPARAPWMGGGDGFVAEHLAFDGSGLRNDDQVSASSLALVDLTGRGGGYMARLKESIAAARKEGFI